MACNLTKEQDGTINIVADNGKPSILFQEAKNLVGNQEIASDIWGVGNSEEYKEVFTEPQIAEYQTTLYKKLNLLQPIQNNIELVVNGKSQVISLSNLNIEKAVANDVVTYTAKTNVNNKVVVLGSLKTNVLEDTVRSGTFALANFKVYDQGKLENLESKGVDTQLYKEAVFDSIENSKSFYFNGGATVSQFLNSGLLEKEWDSYKISAYPQNIDKNREPNVNDVIHYINQENVKERLGSSELTDLKTNLLNTSLQNSDELKEILNTAFFPTPTREKLNRAGIYTAIEIDNILRNTELQNTIKEFALKLNNTEETVEKFSDVDTRFITGTGTGTNSFGKTQITNPYLNEQDAINKLGGVEENLFDSALESSDLNYLKTQKNLFPYFNQFKKIAEKIFTGNKLINKPSTDTQELFNQVLKEDENGAVRGRILRLLNVHPYVWETSSEDVKTLLKGLDRDATKIGLDLKNLEDFYEDKDAYEIKEFLTNLTSMLNTGEIENFTPIYNEFFGIDSNSKVVTEKLSDIDKQKQLFKVNSNDSAYVIFRETGLIPIGNDLYQRTDALRKDLPALYDIVEARGYNLQEIQKEIKNIDISYVDVIDSEVLEKMAIYARLFDSKLDNIKDIPSTIEDQYIKFRPVSETFVSDFYSKQLSEQRKNSENYQNFYNNFEVGENGITLISADPITISNISSQMALYPGLANYFNAKINSDIRFPQEIEEEIDDAYLRKYYANYPQALEMYRETYQQINLATIEAQSKEAFIRIPNGVYELTTMMGNESLYQKLNLNDNTQYKNYNLNEIPLSNITPTSINETNSEVKITNLYSKATESEIDQKLSCI